MPTSYLHHRLIAQMTTWNDCSLPPCVTGQINGKKWFRYLRTWTRALYSPQLVACTLVAYAPPRKARKDRILKKEILSDLLYSLCLDRTFSRLIGIIIFRREGHLRHDVANDGLVQWPHDARSVTACVRVVVARLLSARVVANARCVSRLQRIETVVTTATATSTTTSSAAASTRASSSSFCEWISLVICLKSARYV